MRLSPWYCLPPRFRPTRPALPAVVMPHFPAVAVPVASSPRMAVPVVFGRLPRRPSSRMAVPVVRMAVPVVSPWLSPSSVLGKSVFEKSLSFGRRTGNRFVLFCNSLIDKNLGQ